MKVFGLTGGIACGKSTVSGFLSHLGAAVVDADKASRLVMNPGHPAYTAICTHFGEQILDSNRHINRQALGQIVFNSPEQRKVLEGITHPAIRQTIANQLMSEAQNGKRIGVVEAALLVENGSYTQYSGLIVVSCHPETQLKRLMLRNGYSHAEARVRIESQLPLRHKEEVADWLIMNDTDINSLKAQTHKVWQSILSDQ